MPYQPPALFVAWRDPESRRIFPVARLLRLVSPSPGYEFAYIEGAREALQRNFEPFLAFPKLDEVYRSRDLLPFFKNRVLSSSRPDYAEYVDALDLNAAAAEPMTVLAISGGRRTTDLVEIFPDWTQELAGGSMHTRFFVRGVRYVSGAEARIERLSRGEPLRFVRDLENATNPQAVKLHADDGVGIGFVPDYLAAAVSELLDQEAAFEVRVERVNLPPAPRHHRVLCSLSTGAGARPTGYRGPAFLPISPQATDVGDCAASATSPAAASG